MNVRNFKLAYASRDELIAKANVVTIDLGLLMELTGKAFVIEPKATQRADDGTLIHLGRLDNQVKIRGYRVELGEFETVLRRHPGISQAVVVPVRRGAGTELMALYTGEPTRDADLRRSLAARLPVHLVPHVFLRVDAMPLNPNGKIDRAVATKLLTEQAELARPR